MSDFHQNYNISMGSRITRVIYKDQRKKPIKKQRQQEVKGLITFFLGSVNALYFFLYGYLYRPHIHSHNSLSIFLLVMLLFLYIVTKNIQRIPLFSSVGLFLAIVISKIVGVDLSLFKAACIITTTATTSILCFAIAKSHFLRTLLLWLSYSLFGLGIRLSLKITQLKMQSSDETLKKQESMIALVIFSLIGLMSSVLLISGKKILGINQQQAQDQNNSNKQYIYACLNFILLSFCFCYKHQLSHSFVNQMTMIIICFIVVLLFQKFKAFKYMDILTGLIFLVIAIFDLVTENQASSQLWLNSTRLLIVDLVIFGSILKWVESQSNGTGKPYLIISVYFLAFFISQFSMLAELLASLVQTSNLPTFSIVVYMILIIIYRIKTEREVVYQPIVI